MRRAPCSFGPSVQTVSPHRKKIKSIAGRLVELDNGQLDIIMEDNSTPQGSQLRQPKKRFVGRRTADAQTQNDSTRQGDVESTAVQKGMQNLPVLSETGC